MPFVSRAGEKLAHGLKTFGIEVKGLVCADFGSSTGGFVDCLLQNGATKVYAVETGYGVLEWKLRNDPRVVVMERTNAMHVTLSEQVDFISIDASWTRLEKLAENAKRNLKPTGRIVALLKPHYEANPSLLRKGKLPEANMVEVVEGVVDQLRALGLETIAQTISPITGKKGSNTEILLHLLPIVTK